MFCLFSLFSLLLPIMAPRPGTRGLGGFLPPNSLPPFWEHLHSFRYQLSGASIACDERGGAALAKRGVRVA